MQSSSLQQLLAESQNEILKLRNILSEKESARQALDCQLHESDIENKRLIAELASYKSS